MAAAGLHSMEIGQLMLDDIVLPTDYHINAEKTLGLRLRTSIQLSQTYTHRRSGSRRICWKSVLLWNAWICSASCMRAWNRIESVLAQAPSVIREFFKAPGNSLLTGSIGTSPGPASGVSTGTRR